MSLPESGGGGSGTGRNVVTGGALQLSCHSPLGLRDRTALGARTRQHWDTAEPGHRDRAAPGTRTRQHRDRTALGSAAPGTPGLPSGHQDCPRDRPRDTGTAPADPGAAPGTPNCPGLCRASGKAGLRGSSELGSAPVPRTRSAVKLRLPVRNTKSTEQTTKKVPKKFKSPV